MQKDQMFKASPGNTARHPAPHHLKNTTLGKSKQDKLNNSHSNFDTETFTWYLSLNVSTLENTHFYPLEVMVSPLFKNPVFDDTTWSFALGHINMLRYMEYNLVHYSSLNFFQNHHRSQLLSWILSNEKSFICQFKNFSKPCLASALGIWSLRFPLVLLANSSENA